MFILYFSIKLNPHKKKTRKLLHEKYFLFLLSLEHNDSGLETVHFRMVSEFAAEEREQEGKIRK